MLDAHVQEMARHSVLCWLATADGQGRPNVSPKEIFEVFDDHHMVVANIASPQSVRNIESNRQVCLAFIDVWVQKGYKVMGSARNIPRASADFGVWAHRLLNMAGPRFPIHSVIVVRAQSVQPIWAPSYQLHPDEVSEAQQIANAKRAYQRGGWHSNE